MENWNHSLKLCTDAGKGLFQRNKLNVNTLQGGREIAFRTRLLLPFGRFFDYLPAIGFACGHDALPFAAVAAGKVSEPHGQAGNTCVVMVFSNEIL